MFSAQPKTPWNQFSYGPVAQEKKIFEIGVVEPYLAGP